MKLDLKNIQKLFNVLLRMIFLVNLYVFVNYAYDYSPEVVSSFVDYADD